MNRHDAIIQPGFLQKNRNLVSVGRSPIVEIDHHYLVAINVICRLTRAGARIPVLWENVKLHQLHFRSNANMTISMYQASVPIFIRMLNNLADILKKAATHAETKKIDQTTLLQSRLYPDMFAMHRQVQVAADTAKGCAARLAGAEPPR